MNRREFLMTTGSAAIAMSTLHSVLLAKPSSDVSPTSPDIAALYRDSIVIDALSSPFPDFPLSDPSLTPGNVQQVKSSGVTAVNFTVSDRTFDDTVKNIASAQALADDYPDTFLLVRRHSDIARAKREGKLGVILGFQSVSSLEPDLSRLDTFRGLGVRIIQLSYNLRSLLGDGCMEPANSGLSRRGQEAVARMNQLGIAVDLSHCGQKTTEDGIAVSTKPVLITHAGCSAVHRHPRNKDDRELKALADREPVHDSQDPSRTKSARSG